MAKEQKKKAFVLYNDYKEIFDELSREEAGDLIKHVFSYVNGGPKDSGSKLINMLFIPIRQQLERDEEKYDRIVERNRVNGRKNGKRKRTKEPTGLSGNPKEPKKADTDEETDTDVEKEKEEENTPKPPKGDSIENSESNNQKIDWGLLLEKFNEITGKNARVVPDKAKRQIKARLKEGYSKKQILIAIKNCAKDPYHIENPKYLTIEFISRSDKFEKYVQAITTTGSNQPQKEGIYKNMKSI